MTYNPLKYIGIDVDPLCIGESINRWSEQYTECKFFVHDMNKNTYDSELNSLKELQDKFDYIICNFSIHFSSQTKENLINWITKINEVTTKNSVILFNFLNCQKLETQYQGNYNFDNTSYMKMMSKGTNDDFSYMEIETFFSWTHSKPIIEKIAINDTYEKLFSKYGWKKSFKYNPDGNSLDSLYTWVGMEKFIY